MKDEMKDLKMLTPFLDYVELRCIDLKGNVLSKYKVYGTLQAKKDIVTKDFTRWSVYLEGKAIKIEEDK